MRCLALETAEIAASLAALDGERVLAERRLGPDQRAARELAPAMRDLLEQVGWQPREVQLTAVALGPGSFTGLRIGVTTAKAFAYAIGGQILGINTLQAIALRTPSFLPVVSAVLDALRGQLFAASFRRTSETELEPVGETRLVDVDRWLRELEPGSAVTGTGLEKLLDRLPAHVTVVDRALWAPSAAAVGLLAQRQFLAGRRDDVMHLVPRYYRRTAAEEQWERKINRT